MSNAEMPPLACGQVWRYGLLEITLGDDPPSPQTPRRRRIVDSRGHSIWADDADEEYAETLRLTRARLIHGPGAPWSPAEEVPHA